jgi:outer membrane protein TolC
MKKDALVEKGVEKKVLSATGPGTVNAPEPESTDLPTSHPSILRPHFFLSLPLVLVSCSSPAVNKESADTQVYGILDMATAGVTGQHKIFALERPVDTLRHQLIESKAPVHLTLLDSLDVAAENSREFQRQKEQLYLAALDLTRTIHDFTLHFNLAVSGAVSGVGDDHSSQTALLGDSLAASANGTAGTTIVASFVNTFLRTLFHGGRFDGSSIFNLTLTQPLLAGSGQRIAREPLTQSEREVVYAVRNFEHFRSTFTVSVVSSYYDIVRQVKDLSNVQANYDRLVTSRQQIEELFKTGRRTITDLGRAKQSEFSADAQRVAAKSRLDSSLDRFKLLLGLPITAQLELDSAEMVRLRMHGVEPITLSESDAVAIALSRRYDHRTIVDQVEDAGRRVMVSEDALNMALDFTAALNVPAESGKGLNLDWSKINWSAGFQLDLALDKLIERNAYRAALINFDAALRAREQSADQIATDVRGDLRNIQSAYDTYRIQVLAVQLADQRVDATQELYAAGRVQAIDTLDALSSQLQAQLDLAKAIVDYSVARLSLMRDLEAIALEPKGLRFDPALPMPPNRPAEEHP